MAKPAKLSKREITIHLTKLNGSPRSERGWRHTGNALMREFVCGSFTGAARFIGRIAPIANAMDHHPDLQLYRYKRVKITLTTHDAGGITQKDFNLAAKIDKLAPTSKSG